MKERERKTTLQEKVEHISHIVSVWARLFGITTKIVELECVEDTIFFRAPQHDKDQILDFGTLAIVTSHKVPAHIYTHKCVHTWQAQTYTHTYCICTHLTCTHTHPSININCDLYSSASPGFRLSSMVFNTSRHDAYCFLCRLYRTICAQKSSVSL